MKRVLYEAAMVLGLAILLSIVATSLRPDVVAFLFESRSSRSSLEPLGGVPEISISDAFHMLKQKSAIFVDARSPEDFQQLHINGARNLPESEKDSWLDAFMAGTAPDTVMIAYCSDIRCHLAKDLAETLQFAGFDHVYYMKDGLEEWRKQGMPTEQGG